MKSWLLWLGCIGVLVTVPLGLLALRPSSVDAQAVPSACVFQLGFASLRSQIPNEVGECLEDEQFNPANGNVEQRTRTPSGTPGLLVWRKADNWTAFTNGYRTWIAFPNGVQTRLNVDPPLAGEAVDPSVIPVRTSSSLPYRLGANPSVTSGTVRLDPAQLGRPLLPAAPSGRVDLSAQVPPIGDQGVQSSCTGWAVSYYVKTYQEAREQRWDTSANRFSPAFVYNQCNNGEDKGCTLADALRIVLNQGDLRLTDFPYDESNFRRLPNEQQRGAARPFVAAAFGRLWGHGERPSVGDLRQALSVGEMPIVAIAIHLNDAFRKGPVFDVPAPGDELAGYHALAVVGFNDATQRFKVANSWGTDWGEAGFGYVTYDFVGTGHMVEAWLMTDAVNLPIPGPDPSWTPSYTPTPTPTATRTPSHTPTPTATATATPERPVVPPDAVTPIPSGTGGAFDGVWTASYLNTYDRPCAWTQTGTLTFTLQQRSEGAAVTASVEYRGTESATVELRETSPGSGTVAYACVGPGGADGDVVQFTVTPRGASLRFSGPGRKYPRNDINLTVLDPTTLAGDWTTYSTFPFTGVSPGYRASYQYRFHAKRQ